MVRVSACSPDRWASVTQHRTPRASAAAANPGQRSSSRVSGQLIVPVLARASVLASVSRLARASSQGAEPAVSCSSNSSARSGWLAARTTGSAPRQTAEVAPEQPGTCRETSPTSWFSDREADPPVMLSSSRARRARSSVATPPPVLLRLPNYCRMAHYSQMAAARKHNPEVETSTSPVQGDQLGAVADRAGAAGSRRPGPAADRQQDRTRPGAGAAADAGQVHEIVRPGQVG